ncbi:MAG: carbohydrate ABC transporter permease [Spirochaetales bacterium]|nr:carbohydrate ABC transporter permease [Spirochaetales bacterium]
MSVRRYTATDYVLACFMGILALVIVLPFYNVIIRSFATPKAVNSQLFYLIPTSFDLSTYRYVFEKTDIARGLMNSTLVVLVGTSLNMFVTTTGAYALSRKKYPGKSLFMILIVITMLFDGGIIPFYMTVKGLGLINSFLAMILPASVDTFLLIILINHFRHLPPSLEESAHLDGANDVRILTSILLPVSKASVAAVGLFYAVARWNEWWLAMFFINNTDQHPLQLMLRELINSAASTLSMAASAARHSTVQTMPEIMQMAGVVITVVPIMCVYPLIQPYFARGVMVGAIKG